MEDSALTKQRNYNIDLFRAFSILLIIIYHSWVLLGSISLPYLWIDTIIKLGGEIGVTSFFALSGYGIYCSLANKEEKQLSLKKWIYKRCIRIMPHYYICLILCIGFMSGAYYLSIEHVGDILTHFLFIHNLFPTYFGEINGVLWTMGVIVQFYFISIPLYKLMKGHEHLFFISSIIFTICVKTFIYRIVLVHFGVEDSLTFYAGRQLLTSLDNFTAGMYVAYLLNVKEISLKRSSSAILLISSIIVMYLVCRVGLIYGIHTLNLSGYSWHSLLTITITGIMVGISFIPLAHIQPLYNLGLLIAKYEYGIYLWHLLLIRNMLEKAPVIAIMVQGKKYVLLTLIFVGLSIGFGILMSIMVDNNIPLKHK